jgi:agmatine deiminase
MTHVSRTLAAALCAALTGFADAQTVGRDGRLVYDPDGPPLPRSMTPLEQWYVARYPIAGTDTPTPPPTGPVRCVAEYEPMDGIIVSWMASQSILAQMGFYVTTVGNANLYVALPNAATQPSAQATLVAAGANMGRVKFMIPSTSLNSVWVRDYGPRYIYQGQCRAVVDHKYNRPRPADDVFPLAFSQYKHHAFYEHQLVHGGGNYHLDALYNSFCTRLVNNENPTLTEQQIHDIWWDYQRCDTTFFTPFPTSIDSTQHLDMWMQVAADDKVFISDWPLNPGSTQDQICDAAAVTMAARGYQVTRLPAFSISGVHYTYTNMVICNDVVMIPSFTQTTVAPYNAQALAAAQSVFTGRTVVQVDCQSIISLAGAIHCIVMHVPKHLGAPGPSGGLAPTAYLVNLNGGQSLQAGAQQQITWITDDDDGVSNVDLRLSIDGGQTFPTLIAAGIPDTGSYTWVVNNTPTSAARIRVVARDAVGNTGSDDSDANFTITASTCYADCNGDGVLGLADFGCFQTKFALGDPYADCNGDGILGLADFGCFQTKFALGCP